VGDVDLVVYTRTGEQRVVPIAIQNERRRESAMTLELSGWSTRGGNPAPVSTVSLEPQQFTLAPCAEQNVTLVIKVEGGVGGRENETRDVDACLVARADLRLLGCEHRPVRIAVAILPRDCDPFRIDCGCACC
jgi:hypothetical protein